MTPNAPPCTQITDTEMPEISIDRTTTVTDVDSFEHLLKKQNVCSSQIEQLKMVKQYKGLVTSSIQLFEFPALLLVCSGQARPPRACCTYTPLVVVQVKPKFIKLTI